MYSMYFSSEILVASSPLMMFPEAYKTAIFSLDLLSSLMDLMYFLIDTLLSFLSVSIPIFVLIIARILPFASAYLLNHTLS